MAKRKPHRKPSRPLGHIVFPKTGRPRQVVEPLPEAADDLEATIVRKFIGALRQFEGRALGPPVKGSPWPDFETREGEWRIGIEVVEVLNPDHAAKRRVQELYAARVRELINDVAPQLAGLSIQLDDGYQEPRYPAVVSGEGEQLARTIADKIRSAADSLDALPPGRPRAFTWQGDRDIPTVGAIITRLAPPESGAPVRIHYFGSFPERKEVAEAQLAQAVESKIGKHYSRYGGGRLLLLAYSQDALWGDAPIRHAKRVLTHRDHPFDEVWYIFPYAGEDLGHIVRIWP